MSIAELFIRRPVMTTLAMFAILLFGIMGYLSLPVSDLPSVDYPTINVHAGLPGASPETMASSVALPLEKQFSTIAGLDSMNSQSSLGSTGITLQFNLSRNIDAAAQDVQAAIASASRQLPPNMPSPPTYSKQNPAEKPVLYLAVSSVFRFGLEKKVGALELLAYGPADGTSYFLAALIKDILMTAIYLVVLFVFLQIAGLLNNLILGPSFYYSLIVLFFMSVAIYAYGILASSLTDNSASAIAVFLGLILFFIIIMMGSFTVVSGYVRNLASVFAWIIKWISPLFYWDLALRFVEVGNWGMYFIGAGLLLVLAAVVLFISHLTIKTRGLRS